MLRRSVTGEVGSDTSQGRLLLFVDQFEEVFTAAAAICTFLLSGSQTGLPDSALVTLPTVHFELSRVPGQAGKEDTVYIFIPRAEL